MEHDMKSSMAEHLGGGHKPAKEIESIKHKKSDNGDHIFTHRHTHPEHHPDEVHTKRGNDEMVEHMLKHAGTPNPGEAEAEAGTPDSYNPAATAPGAAPAASPMGSGAPAAGPQGAM